LVHLAELRRARRLTQLDAALLAGTSRPYYALIESGRRRPNAELRERLVRGFQLTEEGATRVVELTIMAGPYVRRRGGRSRESG